MAARPLSLSLHLSVFALLLSSCGFNRDEGKIAVELEIESSTLSRRGQVASLPTNMCYFLHIQAPDIGTWDPNEGGTCSAERKPYGLGRGSMMAAKGGSIEVSVPAGKGRVFQILGVEKGIAMKNGSATVPSDCVGMVRVAPNNYDSPLYYRRSTSSTEYILDDEALRVFAYGVADISAGVLNTVNLSPVYDDDGFFGPEYGCRGQDYIPEAKMHYVMRPKVQANGKSIATGGASLRVDVAPPHWHQYDPDPPSHVPEDFASFKISIMPAGQTADTCSENAVTVTGRNGDGTARTNSHITTTTTAATPTPLLAGQNYDLRTCAGFSNGKYSKGKIFTFKMLEDCTHYVDDTDLVSVFDGTPGTAKTVCVVPNMILVGFNAFNMDPGFSMSRRLYGVPTLASLPHRYSSNFDPSLDATESCTTNSLDCKIPLLFAFTTPGSLQRFFHLDETDNLSVANFRFVSETTGAVANTRFFELLEDSVVDVIDNLYVRHHDEGTAVAGPYFLVRNDEAQVKQISGLFLEAKKPAAWNYSGISIEGWDWDSGTDLGQPAWAIENLQNSQIGLEATSVSNFDSIALHLSTHGRIKTINSSYFYVHGATGKMGTALYLSQNTGATGAQAHIETIKDTQVSVHEGVALDMLGNAKITSMHDFHAHTMGPESSAVKLRSGSFHNPEILSWEGGRIETSGIDSHGIVLGARTSISNLHQIEFTRRSAPAAIAGDTSRAIAFLFDSDVGETPNIDGAVIGDSSSLRVCSEPAEGGDIEIAWVGMDGIDGFLSSNNLDVFPNPQIFSYPSGTDTKGAGSLPASSFRSRGQVYENGSWVPEVCEWDN